MGILTELIPEPTAAEKMEVKEKTEVLPCYILKPLMSRNELKNYFVLRSMTDGLGLEVFTKVRIWDLVEPNSKRIDRQTLENRISKKHIDFVIWNPKTKKVVLLLEILDPSHYEPKRKRRDKFVFGLAKEVGYEFEKYPEVIPYKMEYLLKKILEKQGSSPVSKQH